MDRTEQQQENQKKKDYLNGYGNAKNREKRIQEQIRKLRLDKMCPSVKYDDMPHGTDIGDLSDYMVQFEKLMDELTKERLKAVTQYTEIYRQIKRVEDDRERDILVYRYLQRKKWEDICVLMELSWRHVHRIHGDALKNFPNDIEWHTHIVI
ncbi:DUF1492 domain-containing protein [Muricomes intestini]|uniref:DUF1492 domain-containing protein n=1 Tax=Muricomes intestini TaxID=1796634 RepID=UPI002FDE62C9